MQSPLITMLFLFLSLHYFSFIKSQGDGREVISSDPSYYFNLCSTSTCNNVSLPYPFSPPTFCHNPQLLPTCVNNQYLTLSSKLMVDSYRVLNITSDSTGYTFLAASDYLFGCGKVTWPNYFADPNLFSLSGEYKYGTYLNCTQYPVSAPPGSLQPIACLECDARSGGNTCLYTPGLVNYPECENFFIYSKVGVNMSEIKDLRGFAREGFQIKYTMTAPCLGCGLSGGRCGSSPAGSFVCFCPSSAHPSNCSDGAVIDLRTWIPSTGKSKLSKVVIAAICISVGAVIAIATLVATLVIINRRKLRRKQDGDNPQVDMEDLVKGISPMRYSSSQIKKFTSNFSTKLGEGGFGSVYKGVIQGVGPVAVKILKRSERNEKQFMNEVVTIGRVHHNNLVRLLGYCAQGKMRALVYEFVEKGSLDHYIYKSTEGITNQGNNSTLTAHQMFNIALETAKGILYLHQGCRSRILHCDIKPHNVLLDSNFSAKVADFGLARMIDKDHSHVSLTNAQGTPGYAAPEMWTKTYGPITDKSDVYSYGMLLLEMVGGRNNSDSDATDSSQIYFPERVFRHVANGSDLKLRGRVSNWREIIIDRKEEREGEGEEVEVILEKMCLVGLWSIQHIPSNRPSMSKVIQMLEGKVEIETPPQPFPEESSGGTFTSYLTTTSASIVHPNGKGEDKDKSSME